MWHSAMIFQNFSIKFFNQKKKLASNENFYKKCFFLSSQMRRIFNECGIECKLMNQNFQVL